MLKADMHMHSREDKRDVVDYTAKELIDRLASLNFNVMSFTFHDQSFKSEEIEKYAKSKDILIIPGIERRIQGMDILIYNVPHEKVIGMKTLDDLKKIKNKNSLIIAPHPFFGIVSIGKKLEKYIDVIDGIEHSSYYSILINRNKKAIKIAKKFNKPLVGNSDAHYLYQIGSNYTLIDAEKNIDSVIQAIKNNKIKLETRTISLAKFIRIFISLVFLAPIKGLKRRN